MRIFAWKNLIMEQDLTYAQKATEGMDKLWEQGAWSAEKNESILHEHPRTPYKYAK